MSDGHLQKTIEDTNASIYTVRNEAAWSIAWAMKRELRPAANDRAVEALAEAIEDFLRA